MKKVEQAQTNLKTANLRILAASQRASADAHRRQALHPIYPGQETICKNKADLIDAFAARSDAQADLIEAQSGV